MKEITYNPTQYRIEISFPFSFGMKNKVKEIPDAQFDWDARVWYLPPTKLHAKFASEFGKNHEFFIDKYILDLSRINQTSNKKTRAKLFPYQREGLDFLHASGGRALLCDSPGVGKQQPIDTNVLTPTGWVEIGSLKVGDKVIGSNGKPAIVKGVYPQGKKTVVEMWFSDGSHVECGLHHLWTMYYRKAGRDYTPLVLQTIDMMGDNVYFYTNKRGQMYSIDLDKTLLYLPMLSAPVEFEQKEELPIPPYTMGQMIANGYISNHSIVISSNILDGVEVAERIRSEGSPIGTVNITSQSGVQRLSIVDKTIYKVRDLHLDVGSKEKFIPKVYMYASVENRIALFHGLMDGDGSISKERNKISYSSCSKALAYDVRDLVEGLGGVATVNMFVRNDGKPTEYRVRIRVPNYLKPFSISRKLDRYNPGKNSLPVRTLQHIRMVGQKESVCISVDTPDQLYVTEHCILTHNTHQAIAYMEESNQSKVLVVSPASVCYMWQDKIQELLKGWSTVVIEGYTKKFDTKVRVVICSYNVFTSRVYELKELGFSLVIYDEIHALSNINAKRSKAARVLLTENILGLSGTPFLNRPVELYPLLNLIQPHIWSNYWKFVHRYCDAKKDYFGHWDVKGASNLPELKKKIEHIMLRRTKDDVLKDLPDLTKNYLPYLPQEKSLIKTYQEAYEVAKAMPSTVSPRIRILGMRKVIGLMKVKPAIELAEDILVDNGKVVLFAIHKDVVAQLEEGLKKYNVVKIVGDTPQKDRNDIVNQFQSNPEIRVAIISEAGGEGINLFAASNLIFVEREWNPGKEIQIMGRVHRIGQTKPVSIYYIIAKNTIDERIHRLIEKKAEILGQVISFEDIPVNDLFDIS